MLKVTFKGLKKEFDKLHKELREEVFVETEDSAEAMQRMLYNATPVDKGRAREGWKVTEKRISLFSKETEITIENDVEYIDRLNLGSSKQAAPRFIERTAMKLYEPNGLIVNHKRSRS